MAKIKIGSIQGNVLVKQNGEYPILGISKNFAAVVIEHYSRVDLERKVWDTSSRTQRSSTVGSIYYTGSGPIVQTQCTLKELPEVYELIRKSKLPKM